MIARGQHCQSAALIILQVVIGSACAGLDMSLLYPDFAASFARFSVMLISEN